MTHSFSLIGGRKGSSGTDSMLAAALQTMRLAPFVMVLLTNDNGRVGLFYILSYFSMSVKFGLADECKSL